MTGFGRSENNVGDKIFLIDIKSLNGKQFDLNLRLPFLLKPIEFEIRKIIAEKINRGSIDCIISLKETGSAKPVAINTDLAKSYFLTLSQLSNDLGVESKDLISTIIKLPEVITPNGETLTEEESDSFKNVLMDAINNINHHRLNEGAVLEKELVGRITAIENLLEQIIVLIPQRKEKIKEGFTKIFEENKITNIDENRLEQELIYYIEKIDITEEQVRLKNHCDYFKTILNEEGDVKGKKLSFILQEVGREINTTGSKAYDAQIQKLVVMMKDELEKAKEQVLNVL